mmetsp:Transcript_7795/g.48331  ORF Transcript_7795/g.48331 Transcript_7795/m.48331 type:complete len:524 (-) Transcript_7795:5162-6733(-)
MVLGNKIGDVPTSDPACSSEPVQQTPQEKQRQALRVERQAITDVSHEAASGGKEKRGFEDLVGPHRVKDCRQHGRDVARANDDPTPRARDLQPGAKAVDHGSHQVVIHHVQSRAHQIQHEPEHVLHRLAIRGWEDKETGLRFQVQGRHLHQAGFFPGFLDLVLQFVQDFLRRVYVLEQPIGLGDAVPGSDAAAHPGLGELEDHVGRVLALPRALLQRIDGFWDAVRHFQEVRVLLHALQFVSVLLGQVGEVLDSSAGFCGMIDVYVEACRFSQLLCVSIDAVLVGLFEYFTEGGDVEPHVSERVDEISGEFQPLLVPGFQHGDVGHGVGCVGKPRREIFAFFQVGEQIVDPHLDFSFFVPVEREDLLQFCVEARTELGRFPLLFFDVSFGVGGFHELQLLLEQLVVEVMFFPRQVQRLDQHVAELDHVVVRLSSFFSFFRAYVSLVFCDVVASVSPRHVRHACVRLATMPSDGCVARGRVTRLRFVRWKEYPLAKTFPTRRRRRRRWRTRDRRRTNGKGTRRT